MTLVAHHLKLALPSIYKASALPPVDAQRAAAQTATQAPHSAGSLGMEKGKGKTG